MDERANAEERQRNQRFFDTTQRENFCQKDLTANTVGRKVMKTQDGQLVAMGQRDEQLIVESGMYRRT